MSGGKRAQWEQRWSERAGPPGAPSAWVAARALAAAGNLNLDVAGGDGRHALALVRAGFAVIVADYALAAVRRAREVAGAEGLVADALRLPLREGALDLIVIVNFLERSLFSHVPRLLRPGGTLVVETYTTRHAALVSSGRAHGPASRAYMLAPGELARLAGRLEIVEHWEGEVEDGAGVREVARLVARRGASGT